MLSAIHLFHQVAEPMQMEFVKLKEARENPTEEMQSKFLQWCMYTVQFLSPKHDQLVHRIVWYMQVAVLLCSLLVQFPVNSSVSHFAMATE